MLEACVLRSGVNHALHAELPYAGEALEHRVFDERKDKSVGYGYETVDGVDYVFHFSAFRA